MEFNDFLDHDEDSVRKAAEILEEAKTGLEEGMLSREQFDEIAEDVLQIEEMTKLADSLERKIAIQQAVSALRSIVSSIPL